MGSQAAGKLILLSQQVLTVCALPLGVGPMRPGDLPHLHWDVNCCRNCSSLVQAAMLLRFRGCSFPVIGRRHILLEDSRVPWLLQSLCPLFPDVPRVVSVEVVLQMYPLGLGTSWSVVRGILTSQGRLWRSPSAAKRSFF